MSNKNFPVSVRQRLLNLSLASSRPFSEVLEYYMMERFIYRLSKSCYNRRFVLKGALMFSVWNLSSSRSTKDIDLLGTTNNSIDNITKIVKNICKIECVEDGVMFYSETVKGDVIKKNGEYNGIRSIFYGSLAKARVRMQIDIGFDDLVHPCPVNIEYPTLLGMPSPCLLGYNPETVVAEKLHAMVYHGVNNSRMKDYFDIWYISRQFDFDKDNLESAIRKTFANRKTVMPLDDAYIFSKEYKTNIKKHKQWEGFIAKNSLSVAPGSFNNVMDEIKSFILPVISTAIIAE